MRWPAWCVAMVVGAMVGCAALVVHLVSSGRPLSEELERRSPPTAVSAGTVETRDWAHVHFDAIPVDEQHKRAYVTGVDVFVGQLVADFTELRTSRDTVGVGDYVWLRDQWLCSGHAGDFALAAFVTRAVDDWLAFQMVSAQSTPGGLSRQAKDIETVNRLSKPRVFECLERILDLEAYRFTPFTTVVGPNERSRSTGWMDYVEQFGLHYIPIHGGVILGPAETTPPVEGPELWAMAASLGLTLKDPRPRALLFYWARVLDTHDRTAILWESRIRGIPPDSPREDARLRAALNARGPVGRRWLSIDGDQVDRQLRILRRPLSKARDGSFLGGAF